MCTSSKLTVLKQSQLCNVTTPMFGKGKHRGANNQMEWHKASQKLVPI